MQKSRRHIRNLTMMLWVVLLLVQTVPAGASGCTIAIREYSTVKDSVVKLGDIAVITGGDAQRIAGMKAIVLMGAPEVGTVVTLSSGQLGEKLAASGYNFQDVTWQVPAMIQIATEGQIVSRQTLAAAAEQALHRHFSARGEDYQLHLIGYPLDSTVPAGKVSLRCEIPYGTKPVGVIKTEVIIQVDGRVYNRIYVPFEVRSFQDVVVANRAISTGEIATAECFRTERTDSSRLSAGYMNSPERLIGQAAKRPVPAGAVINESMFAQPVLIRKGAVVKVVARYGSVEVTANVQALQDGVLGQMIRVQNVENKKILAAKVADEGTVVIGPGHD